MVIFYIIWYYVKYTTKITFLNLFSPVLDVASSKFRMKNAAHIIILEELSLAGSNVSI